MRRTLPIAVLLALSPSPAWAAPAAWRAPWSVSDRSPLTPDATRAEPAPAAPPSRDTAVAKIYLLGAVRFYQRWISPADGASCGFYPTCSGYAVDALRKHGAVAGFVMTAERVMRNHGGASYPLIQKLGRERFYDPVDANDYWWSGPRPLLADADAPASDAGVPAPEAAEPEPEPELGFARSLYDDGDYYRAIGEAKRVLYHHPGDRDAQVLIGEAYLAGEQWQAAEAALEPVASVEADAAFGLADARMGAKEFDLAALDYRHFAADFPADPRAALAVLRTGWARL